MKVGQRNSLRCKGSPNLPNFLTFLKDVFKKREGREGREGKRETPRKMVGLGWVGQRPLVVARVFTGAPLPMMVGPTRKSYETQLRLVFCPIRDS